VTIELWTHEREGLSENDFIVAAKLDQLLGAPPASDLLSKKQPQL
jgi:pterin-4a-carbinolamine dehydratase